MIGLGIGLFSNVAATSGGGGGGFTPASISGLDFWIEAADLTRLYTDNGTTHVSADGDAVYLWKDKSGAARDVFNATLGSRPLYKTDLSKPSIKFDGVDDLLASTTDVTWDDGSGQHWFAVSMQSTNVTGNAEIMSIRNNSATYNSDIYTGASAVHLENLTSGGFEEDASAATLAVSTPVVLIGTITTTQIEAFVDNSSNGAHTNAGTPSTIPGHMLISGGGASWAGRLFGACHGKGVLSSANRASLQTYLAALHP